MTTFRLYVGGKRVPYSTLTPVQLKAVLEHDMKTKRFRWIKAEQDPTTLAWGSLPSAPNLSQGFGIASMPPPFFPFQVWAQ